MRRAACGMRGFGTDSFSRFTLYGDGHAACGVRHAGLRNRQFFGRCTRNAVRFTEKHGAWGGFGGAGSFLSLPEANGFAVFEFFFFLFSLFQLFEVFKD